MLKQQTVSSLLVLFAGAILPLAFAPFGYYLIAEFSLVLLLFVWNKTKSSRLSFWYGWLFGVSFFGCGVYWIYNSIHDFGHAPAIVAITILALLITVLALYPALLGYLLNRFYIKSYASKWLLAFPAGWVLLEWLRGWFLSGFPWLFLGYGHVSSFLGGWAPIFGVYGVSFAIAQIAGTLICLFHYRRNVKALMGFILLLSFLWGGGFYLKTVSWVKSISEPIQVSLIQGNFSLEQKWDSEQLLPIFNYYANTTTKNFTSKIVVWPEAAVPTFPENVAPYLHKISKLAKAHKTAVITGILFYDEPRKSYYNGILALGTGSGHYYKRHLVPFGEYLPMPYLFRWLASYIEIPMADCSTGSDKQPDLLAGEILLAPFVCYEIAYPELVLEYLPRAELLITVCDDIWFGRSIASAQHLEIAQMRSLEVGRDQLLSTNTGITAVIAANGKVMAQLPEFAPGVLTMKVQRLAQSTPWVQWGHYVGLALLLLFLSMAYLLEHFSRIASLDDDGA